MNVNFSQRCLAMLMVLMMLFTMTPTYVLAEEVHDHSHEATETGESAVSLLGVEELAVSASASANYVYAGEGAVTVTAKISGGMAPYTVSLQAVKDGSVVFTDTATTETSSAKLSYTPASYGDYELVVTVHDALHAQDLTTMSLAVAEHDTESEAEWAASVSGASVSSNWAKSLVSVAKTQVGYAESEKDFILKSGEKQGYSRYGAWYGTPYAGWNTAFLSFVAEYAKIPNDALLSGSSYRSWVNGMSAKGAYMKAGSDYAPKAGDIAFLSGSRVAIIESVSGTTLNVIEGDVNGAVMRKQYAISKVAGIGNTELMQGLYNGTATAVPTAAPETTKAPAGDVDVTAAPAVTAAPTATPLPEVEDLVFQATPTPGPGVTVAPKDDADPLKQFAGQMGDLVGELDAAATAIPAEFSEAYYLMQAEIHKLMEKYLGEGPYTTAAIKEFVDGLELGDVYYILLDLEDLDSFAGNVALTEEEFYAVLETQDAFVEVQKAIDEKWRALQQKRGSISLLSGNATFTYDEGSITASSDNSFSWTHTITGGTYLPSAKWYSLTISNNYDKAAVLTFDWARTQFDSLFDTSVSELATSGSKTITLEAGAEFDFEAYAQVSRKNSQTNVLTVTNITLTPVADKAKYTIEYNSIMGNVTVDDADVSNGDVLEIEYATGAALVAEAHVGYTFLGWMNKADNSLFSTDSSYTLKSEEDVTVVAVFSLSSEKNYYKVFGGTKTYLTQDLNHAGQLAAADASSKKIVPLDDITLEAGDYTIPAGVTLLIPFDDANTLYTTEPKSDSSLMNNGAYVTPTAYRTLTMANGANLIINGAMSLSAKHHAANGGARASGAPTGKVSFVQMEEGSTITVNNGGNLYVWGYITGSGSVTAKSGANVYENFQVEDFRGGDVTTQLVEKYPDYGVFPIAAYYVQNIEVPLTLEYGASETSYTSVFMSQMSMGAPVKFISSSGAMFNLTSGSVTKQYSNGRLLVTADGEMDIDTLAVSIGGVDINTANFELPINGNITVTVKSGSILNINQDIAMLPGAKIVVESGAVCNMNAKAYVYDASEWGPYIGAGGATALGVTYAPGGDSDTTIADAELIVNGTVVANNGAYTTKSGAAIISTGNGKVTMTVASNEPVTYQHNQAAGGATQEDNFVDIPITSAQLKNGDGTTFTQTNVMPSDVTYYSDNNGNVEVTSHIPGTYYYEDGVWKLWCDANRHLYTAEFTEQTCTEGAHTTYTCLCGEGASNTVYMQVDDGNGGTKDQEGFGHTNPDGDWTCGDFTCETCEKPVTGDGNHNEVTDAAVAATCYATGLTEGKHCDDCGIVIIVQETIEKVDHSPAAAVQEDVVDATCYAEGSYNEVVYCSVEACGAKLSSTPKTIEKKEHAIVIDEAVAPTCTDTGLTEGKHCSACDEVLVAQVIIEETGHNWDDGVEYPVHTCTAAGVMTYTCTNEGCAECWTKDVLAAHTINVLAEELPTCTEAGWREWECIAEGCDAKGIDTLPATGHTEVVVPGKNVTCTVDGLTEGKYCSVCEEILVEQVVIPAGHRWNNAPCTTVGAVCTRCGLTNKEQYEHDMAAATCTKPATCKYGCGTSEGKALGHSEAEIEAIPVLCEEDGWTAGTQCTVCGEIVVAPSLIPAPGHNYVMYEAKNPTFNSEGWYDYEACERCGYTTKISRPALGEQSIDSYEEMVKYLPYLEQWAEEYAKKTPGTDPVSLVIKYIRTGVDRYNSGSWGIMAGYEDKGFAEFVTQKEDEINSVYTEEQMDQMIQVTGLKNLKEFTLPNDPKFKVDFGHMFGTMDITYTNKGSVNHADVGGWAGDLVDLLSTSDHDDHQELIKSAGDDFETLVTVIRTQLLGYDFDHEDTFALNDYYGDIDAFYIMETLDADNYAAGDMTDLFKNYFTESLNDVRRADYLLANRFDDVRTRSAIREAVYTEYTTNAMISTLEGTRDFNNTDDLITRRKAVCYAFADYLCMLAGDWVDDTDNPYLTDYESSYSLLAPGISMEIHKATSADNKNMVYYLGYADLAREDVDVMINYHDRYVDEGWNMSRVLDQANKAADKYYANPESEHYIENFAPVVAVNGAGFNMGTGEPSGLMVMHGEEYHGIDGNGFFGITKAGKAIIGTTAEYNSTYKGQLAEGIAGFGSMLVENGELSQQVLKMLNNPNYSYYNDRASRTAVGITATGRVVFMVLDGRQEPWSCGGSMIEIAQIMKLAGCVTAINMDGGGSTTFVARRAGDEELSLVNRPSDGVQRSVSTSMMMISTAPSSKTFDRALVESNLNFMTVGAEVSVTATGLSATNNIVALPEGAYWAVSDPEMAEIVDSGDVVINADDPTVTKKTAKVTAKKNGEFEVYLMLDGVEIGRKTLSVIIPDQIYFIREKIDGVYGYGVELPLKARYEGKEAAFVPEDITFTFSNPGVGSMEGLTFNVVEKSDVKTVTITAALKLNAEVTASINVVLYKDGENNFNFDNATGGNRELAWLREVSNAKQEGTSTYYIIDPDEDMVTTYTVALDMSQIPIPERLESLTYMLPGSDLEGASAWTFLLQLAERISELTTVTAEFEIDPNFTLIGYDPENGVYDASGLSLINDYFVLNKETPVVYDPTDNTLTLMLNWKGFSQAIDPETANPMCIVSGLKLVPKTDAAWDAKDRLNVVNSAVVGYKVYMRANALHTFSSKPENQETFGLYPYGPYTNSRGIVENGGWFKSTYATFEDTYTLIRSLKNGWVIEEGGFRYYVDGQYLKGIHKIPDDGLYYQFDEKTGINIGQTPYTGLHVEDGYTYYMKSGVPYEGWITLEDGYWYLFEDDTGHGANGTQVKVFSGNRIVYEFDNGRLIDGVWYHDGIGWRYYYGPYYYKQGWRELISQDGQKNKTGEREMYFFEAYYVQNCTSPVQEAHSVNEYWYEFTDEGVRVGHAPTGLYWWDDDWYLGDAGSVEAELYYVVENLEGTEYSVAVTDGLHLIDGDYYYFDLWSGKAYRNTTAWVGVTNDLLPEGNYRFAADGKIILTTGVFDEDGTLYYYLNGKRTANAGLVEYEGNIYGVGSGAVCYVNRSAYIAKDNGLAVGEGTYRFDENGHLIASKAVVDESGTLYYYNDSGKRVANAGLVEFGGDIYYIGAYTLNGETINDKTAIAATDVEINVTTAKANKLLPAGTYRFGEDGKAILTTELVEGDDGKLYYYMNGALQKDAGLIKYEGAYYYIDKNGAAVTDTEMLVEKTIDPFPVDTYEFGSDGKMIIREGIYEGYYYVGGIKTAAGLVEEDGNYYYAAEGGKIVTDTKYNVQKTNDLLTAGTYRINEDGTLNLSTELADEDGTLVYYKDGLLTANAGLIKIDGDYYYIVENGVAVVDAKHKVTITNGLKTAGTYRFDEDGKMILTTELVEEEDGKLYYYIDGRMADKADLIKFNDAYYWIEVNGFAVTNTKIGLGTGELLPTGVYRVGADGKVILTTELVEENGNHTYYKNGILTINAGLIEFEGDYYYIGAYVADGKTYNNNTAIAVVNAKVNVTTAKTNALLTAGTYRFDEDGKAILTTEVVLEADGKYYYYVDGLLAKDAGLIEFEGAYYYITEDGTALTDDKVDVAGSDLLDDGTYRVGEDAKVILTTEVVKESDNKYYYYENGKLGKDAGLVAYNGAYYYITAQGTAVTNTEMEVVKTNNLLPAGTYRFDKEGKADLTTELVEGDDGKLYYYVNGALAEDAGLIEYEGAYYYITADGTAVTDTEMLVEKTNNLFPVDTYEFGEDGKMVIREGIYEGYYYVGGVKTEAGLVKVGDDYYYAAEGGKLVTDTEYNVVKTNDLKPEGIYRFDEEGKMILTTELVEKDGELYYYEDGMLAKDAGLILYKDNYYYIDENGTAVTDTKMLVEKTNDLLPEDTYCFGEDGKMFERLPGDANEDKVVDLNDALLVLKYGSEEGVKINRFNADVNGDDKVDINDALLLMQYSAGWDVELI